MSGRSIDEWIGATPDSPVPPRVRVRVFDRHGGICHVSRRKIRAGEPWDLDHIVALCNGGEHRESNLAPVLRDKHRWKTNKDLSEKRKIARIRQKHLGIRRADQALICRTRFSSWKRKVGGGTERR
jgi:5-methylcytosine-specific restriction endonuclease McrA